jgi:hypothetical protein
MSTDEVPRSAWVPPPGFDQEHLQRLLREASDRRERRVNAATAARTARAFASAQASGRLGELFGLDASRVRQVFEQDRAVFDQSRQASPPARSTPPVGHNPVRYAPFDFAWSQSPNPSGQGLQTGTSYGPDATTGYAGADIAVYLGGWGSGFSGVGFYYYSQYAQNLPITWQASVWGIGYAWAYPPVGYVICDASLVLEVDDLTSGTWWSAQTSIYSQSGPVLYNYTPFDWQVFSASLTLPVSAGHQYAIWGFASQYVYAAGEAGATSNFDMEMGPVSICSCAG